jgi:hypothetical protein
MRVCGSKRCQSSAVLSGLPARWRVLSLNCGDRIGSWKVDSYRVLVKCTMKEKVLSGLICTLHRISPPTVHRSINWCEIPATQRKSWCWKSGEPQC